MIDKNSIIYSLLTDRFDNDNSDLHKKRNSPDYEESLRSYVGGKFNGIINRVPYLKNLGITNLIISPVEKCMPGDYHGYSTTHPLEINSHFGTPEELKRLSRELKEHDIGLILDYVPLTISSKSSLFKEKSKTKRGREWFLFREILNNPIYGEDAQRLAARQDCGESEYFHFFGGKTLPFFNLSNNKVLDYHIRRISSLVKEYSFSDVRLDLGFYMPEKTIKELSYKLKEKTSKQTSILIENWPYPLEQFNGGEGFGLCDGEFNLKGTILLNNWGKEPGLIYPLIDHLYRTKGVSDQDYSFITGINNHDLPRFKGDTLEQKMASTILFTFPNFTPMIYYGDESKMKDEGKDHLALGRGIMDFENSKLLDFYSRLINFRKKRDFNDSKIINIRINDTEDKSNPENQLVTYSISLPKGNEIFDVIINRENRFKPIVYNELFPYSKEDYLYDEIQKRSMVIKEGVIELEPKTPYILTKHPSSFN